ncbi:uncharacterized protein MONBRDRAFT_27131 [Monosiga brevicollis MX1]|uniref:NADH dehydrogenase [ubiquinone] 1 beta subcomplex subunit 9 n=1 Tax=Monosiga brevicollis TaxID=81824 RepID=A9V4E2_MONBE|nr:uncharacterized protein MONBRDRAFT_27131 [Monosiga brevicollis MX1]EDQ87599.1 predicted protein [Monosiga brevicollis MX1]|eukprot:XP_001747519.1 hypothetical protein [Monosiga brevicollis MX1]
MSSAHQLRVLKLYRHSLKNLLSWTVDRGMYRQKAMELRARFEATRFEKNIVKATQLVEAGEAELDEIKHPNPYVGRRLNPAWPAHSVSPWVFLCANGHAVAFRSPHIIGRYQMGA